jgi:hypothetical protein
MRLRALFIIGLALATAILVVATAKSLASTTVFGTVKAQPNTLRVHCPRPSALHLTRFEDGSAQLKCASHILVRVSVPG